MMFDSLNQTTDAEKVLLRKLRVWIASLAAVCILAGIGIGAVLAGRTAVAQDGLQSASRAPEALSASFVEIAQRVEPAVVNIDTTQAADTDSELAVLKIDSDHELPVMKFGDSNAAPVGDWVLAIGSPFGLDQTVTAGIISKKDRDTTSSSFQRFLQTDAAINRGNSGGPLVNVHGEAIGVNSQIATLTGDYNGIGFALPSNEAKFVTEQILSQGKVRRGFLGVTLESVRAEFARVYRLPDAKGAVVVDMPPDRGGQVTPAATAGSQVNDVIVEFNGQPVQDSNDLIAKVAATNVGQSVMLTFLRDVDGKLDRRTAVAMLADRAESISRDNDITPREKSDKDKSNSARLGLTLSELTPQIIEDKHLNGIKGLYIKDVDPNGLAADVRPNEVQAGEVITRINRVPVTSLADFQQVIESLKPGDAIVLNLSTYFRPQNRITSRIVQFTYQ